MKQIAVLLTVFNRKEKTLLCLRNLFAQDVPEGYALDVYLTNDGCTDGTPEAVRKQYPEVHVIDADGNLYWNRGMFTAWETAAKAKDYDYYLWLNDDTFTYSYMLKELCLAAEETEGKAIIVGATEDAKHTVVTYGGRLKGYVLIPDGTLQEVDSFNGNIVLLPRSVYKKIGNLDYYFTHSKGDFDYGMRAKKIGIKIFQVRKILGECEFHERMDRWCDPDVPLRQRWRMLYRPNGMPPKETFHLEKRHVGIGIAAFHYCTIYLRCLFPWIWVKTGKIKGNR